MSAINEAVISRLTIEELERFRTAGVFQTREQLEAALNRALELVGAGKCCSVLGTSEKRP